MMMIIIVNVLAVCAMTDIKIVHSSFPLSGIFECMNGLGCSLENRGVVLQFPARTRVRIVQELTWLNERVRTEEGIGGPAAF